MNRREVITVAVVAMMLSLCVYGIAASPNKATYVHDVHAVAVYRDSFDNCVVNVTADQLYDAGYKVGDYTHISWDDKYLGAIITTEYIGLYTFEYFINIADDGTVSIACQFAEGSLEVGDVVKISYYCDSQRHDILPNYCKGVCERRDWMTDEDYANLRCVATTGMKEGILYRSYGEFVMTTDVRAGCADVLLEKYGIERLLCLSTDLEAIREGLESGQYVAENGKRYVDEGMVFAKDLGVHFMESDDYRDVFEYIADNDGPYLVFCSLGKDRTGFVCTMLEALMGASYEEMFRDYAESYIDLYDMKEGTEEYDQLYWMFDPILAGIHDRRIMEYVDYIDISLIDVSGYDYQKDAENFLIDELGMSLEKVEKLKTKLSA